MSFANLTWLWFLSPLFFLGLVITIYTWARDKKDLELLGGQHFVLDPLWLWVRRVVKGLLLFVVLGLVGLGAARLQGKLVPQDLELSGSDIMIVLDLSKSMLTQDIEPSRLEAAKKAILDWLQGRDGDRVGLTAFAGEAVVQVPLTLDLEAVALVLERDDVDAIDKGGTDIGEGIRTALSSFDKESDGKRGKAILLITDGELTEGASNVQDACQEAVERKIPIVAVGIGTPAGKPIPDGTSFWGEASYKTDENGNVHISRLDEGTLKQIAQMTGGAYIQGDTPQSLSSINQALSDLQKSSVKDKGILHREELSPSLALWAAGALVLSAII